MLHEWQEDGGEDFPPLPGRSQLFNLEPIGLGTSGVESLTSYMVRLAGTHSLPMRRFVSRLLTGSAPGLLPKCDTKFFRIHATTVNGTGDYARRFVDVLQAATGRRDLEQLTLLPWRELLSPNGTPLTHKCRRWCTDCLHHQSGLNGGKSAYSPLAWSLVEVHACSIHGRALEERCALCGRRQPAIPRQANLAVCDACGGRLDERSARQGGQGEGAGFQHVVEQMVALNGTVQAAEAHRRWTEALTTRIGALALDRASVCRRAGLDPRAMNAWINRGGRVSLSAVIRVCVVLNLAPAVAFAPNAAPDSADRKAIPTTLQARAARRDRHTYEARNHAKVLLLGAIAAPTAPTLRSVATAAGTSTGFLRYWHADLVQMLRARTLEQSRRIRLDRERRHEDTVDAEVKRLLRRGIYPGRKVVENTVRSRGVTLIVPRNLAAYRRALTELNRLTPDSATLPEPNRASPRGVG